MAGKTVPRVAAPDECADATDPHPAPGCFGLTTLRASVSPDARLDHLLFDALCLVGTAEAALNAVADDTGDANVFPALYLLRQARLAVEAAQMVPAVAQAAHAAGWRADQ